MAGQDTANYENAMKTVYEGGIRELIPTKVKTLQMFEDIDASPWGGNAVEYAVKVGRNEGVGAASERGALPTAGAEEYATVRIPMRFMYGRVNFSAQLMKASQGAKNAYAPAQEQEMNGLIKNLAAERGRVIFGDGRGVLALVNGDPNNGTTLTLDSPGGVAGATNGNRYIRKRMLITFVNPSTGAIRASSDESVTAVGTAGTTVTTSSTMATAIADNDYVVRANKTALTDVSDTNYAKEPMGLLGHIDDGGYVATYHGLNRTTYPIAGSHVITVNGALSGDVIQRGIDVADQRGDGEISDLIMHPSVRRAYVAASDDARRYMGADLSRPDIGTVAAKRGRLSFGGIPIMEDKYSHYGMIFGVDRSGFRRYVLEAGKWVDEDGAVLTRIGSGSTAEDSFEGWYRIWDNFHVENPAASFRLDSITANVVVVHID